VRNITYIESNRKSLISFGVAGDIEYRQRLLFVDHYSHSPASVLLTVWITRIDGLLILDCIMDWNTSVLQHSDNTRSIYG